jgi:hypothetical protein
MGTIIAVPGDSVIQSVCEPSRKILLLLEIIFLPVLILIFEFIEKH